MKKEIISAKNAPAAVGPYSHAVKAGGVLYTSGLIAGEGLMGVILAGVAAAKLNIDCSGIVNLGSIGSIVLFLALLGSLAYVCMGGKKKA